ncbi:MAG: hypothetical protein LBQ15_03045 [Clostridium sp.]|jgi:ABC-2 type transport system permease protein|nr:hypothetical protein [Clostridium sp.]
MMVKMIKKLFVLQGKALLSGVWKIQGAQKPGAGKAVSAVFLGLIAAAGFFVMLYEMFAAMCEPYFSAGIGWLYFAMLAILVFALCVVSTIFTAAAVVFGAKDNELLLSMPIKPSAILISRVLVLLASEYVFTFIAALAAFVPWLMGGHAAARGVVFFAAGVLLLPPMSLSVALLLAWLLSLVSSKLRYKNVLTLIISVLFLLGYLFVYGNLQSYLGELAAKGGELAEAFRKAMPPFYSFGVSAASGAAGNLAFFAVWALAPFAAALLLLGANYKKTLTVNRGSRKVVYHEKQTSAQGTLAALVGKEMAKFWSRPMVVLNSSIGSVFMLISPVVLLPGVGILPQITALAPLLHASPAALFAAILAFLSCADVLSASLVSLEGKSLWIVKSLPVSAQSVLRAKVLTHLLSSSLPCLFSAVCVGAAFAESLADWLLILFVPQTMVALIAVMGLAVNLHFPKFDWTNEIYVVKQGMSAMLTIFGSMGLLVGLGLLYFFLVSAVVSVTAYFWICGALFAAVGACVYGWLMKSGAKMFAGLSV